MVTSKGSLCASDGPLMVTVGTSRSASTEYRLAGRLGLPVASVARIAATSTVTVPVATGEIVAE